MGRYLNVGNDGFQTVRKGHYVDKTGMIAFINEKLGTKEKLICVSRARRFGKSFAVHMLCAYYDKSCDSRKLFEDLEIAKDPSYGEHINKYDVIYLDITSFISRAARLKDTVADLQKKVAKDLCESYPEAAGEVTLPETMARVHELTGNRFIVLIDEWDALFREAKDDVELQKEYIRLLRGLFKSDLTDRVIEAAYMTGILPIKKYGTQSALTDFREYTMLAPRQLAKYVGFTEPEVKRLCKEYGMDFHEAKKWYDGYYFQDVGSVYNPNAIMQAAQDGKFRSYWTQTETYEGLKLYIDMDFDGLKETIIQMLGDAKCQVDTDMFQNDMTSVQSRDDVLTLLAHLGYLAYDEESKQVFIPNEEIRKEFIRAVKYSRHAEIGNLIKESDTLLQAVLNLDGEAVAAAIEKVHSISTAPVFYNNEQALRSVTRLAFISCMDYFKEIQELPSGTGYADVVYLPKKKSAMPIIVVELKWNKGAEGAIRQIKERNYPEVFEGYGSEILLVGVSYDEKTKRHDCVIERWQKETGDSVSYPSTSHVD